MRQGQQNRRGRGRNRKGQSPLTRSFESTGPDVKIRGTPSHIAEKYMSLARDAASSGDPVLAENYLQHAEHYNRIIMAFRDQQMSQGGPDMNGGMPRNRPFNDVDGDEFGDDEGDDGEMQPSFHGQHSGQMQPPQMRHNDQPRMEGQRFDGQRHDQNRFRDRDRHDRNRHDRGDRGDRGECRDREYGGGEQQAGGQPRHRNPEAVEAGGQQPATEGQQFQRRDRFPQQQHEQPEFLRRPVRRPRREGNGGEVNGTAAATDEADRE
jgi:hypothetical protein